MECPSRVVFPWEVAQQRGATFQKRFILHVRDNTHFRRLTRYAEFQYRRIVCSQPRRQRTPPGTDGPWKRRRYPRCREQKGIGRLNDKIYPFKLVFKRVSLRKSKLSWSPRFTLRVLVSNSFFVTTFSNKASGYEMRIGPFDGHLGGSIPPHGQNVRIIRRLHFIRSAVGCRVEVALYRRKQLFNIVLDVGGFLLAIGNNELHTARTLVSGSR